MNEYSSFVIITKLIIKRQKQETSYEKNANNNYNYSFFFDFNIFIDTFLLPNCSPSHNNSKPPCCREPRLRCLNHRNNQYQQRSQHRHAHHLLQWDDRTDKGCLPVRAWIIVNLVYGWDNIPRTRKRGKKCVASNELRNILTSLLNTRVFANNGRRDWKNANFGRFPHLIIIEEVTDFRQLSFFNSIAFLYQKHAVWPSNSMLLRCNCMQIWETNHINSTLKSMKWAHFLLVSCFSTLQNKLTDVLFFLFHDLKILKKINNRANLWHIYLRCT